MTSKIRASFACPYLFYWIINPQIKIKMEPDTTSGLIQTTIDKKIPTNTEKTNLFVLPTSEKTVLPIVIRALRTHAQRGEFIVVGRDQTAMRAKKQLRENFVEIIEILKKEGWINQNEHEFQFQFEIVNEDKHKTIAIPLSQHPTLGSNKQTMPENPLYYEPESYATLKDPQRYLVECIGNNHYLVNNPQGESFVVEMDHHNGLGACSCPDYAVRHSPTRKKMLEIGELTGLYIHEDCCHLRHLKFLRGTPFGKKTPLTKDQLTEPGQA
jgi:hypothetical protein